MKQKIRIFLAAFFITVICGLTTFAAPAIRGVEYEGKGKVEVNFAGKVQYKKAKVTVTDSKGKKYKAVILGKDNDELEFKVKGYKAGKTYRFTISGIRNRGEKKYGKAKGKVWIPKTSGKVPVKEIEYDKKDREVSFDFQGKVEWKNLTVQILSGNKNYVVRISEYDDDDLEVLVKSLKKGKVYQYRISGIRRKGDTSFTTISGSFTA